MTNVYANIESMRNTAEQVRRTCASIEYATDTVYLILRTLPPELKMELYLEAGAHGLPTNIITWSRELLAFADRLHESADALQSASQLADDPTVVSEARGRTLGDILPPLMSLRSPAKPLLEIPADAYIGTQNQASFERMQATRDGITREQDLLARLTDERTIKADDLRDLRARLMANGVTNVDNIARVQALHHEIVLLDTEMAGSRTRLGELQARLSDMQRRWELITPAPGADLALIHHLEQNTTAPYILDRTYDCVNHIVNKVTIPDGMPTDAHLWDDNILKHPEYGIRRGTEALPGAIIVMEREHSYASDVYGHLLYVERVEGSQIWVTDHLHSEPVLLSDLTDETSGANIHYLYLPWHTRI